MVYQTIFQLQILSSSIPPMLSTLFSFSFRFTQNGFSQSHPPALVGTRPTRAPPTRSQKLPVYSLEQFLLSYTVSTLFTSHTLPHGIVCIARISCIRIATTISLPSQPKHPRAPYNFSSFRRQNCIPSPAAQQ